MSVSASPSVSDALVREGLDQMAQGMTIFDADLKLVTWNRRFLDLLRFPAALAFCGAEFESFIRHNALNGEYGPGDVDKQVAERVARARAFQPHDFERNAPDGTIIRVVGSPLPTGGFVTVYTDVTAEKNRSQELEAQVARRTEQLRLSEARLQLIADEVPAGIAHVDRDMTILFTNRRFARAYGWLPSQIIGKPCKEVLHPETLRESHRFFEQARRGAVVDFEMRITLPSGTQKDIRTFLRPAQPSAGEVIGFYLLSVDVTHRKASNQALLQSQKMDALGRLSSGISHDFNNLLAIVMGNLVPLAEQLDDPVLVQEYLEPALAAARRGSNLTRRLLTLARSEPIDPRAVQLDESLEDFIKLLRASVSERITISYGCEQRLPPVWVDPAQLEMALLNLAINARDSMQGQGQLGLQIDTCQLQSAEADLRKLPTGPYVRVRVSDDGCGMTTEQSERIFEPFFTSKSDAGGTGLGLAMVFGFVRQSNGAIWVESTPGTGSTFSILLPVSTTPAARTGTDTVQATSGPITAPARDPLVLLVEDNAHLRSVLRRQLVDLGYALLEASDAAQALTLLDSVQGIDLLLSDVAMPGAMDGEDLARHVRAQAPTIGIVLMSGQKQSLPADLNASEPGVPGFGFLTKPFDKQDLALALKTAGARPIQDRNTPR